MPQHVPLSPGDPGHVGRYRLRGRIEGIPSEDPIFIGSGPDGAQVTLSMLRGEWSQDVAARDRFAAEAAAARRVPPFCAARVLDADADESGAYLVSEYIPGPSLLDVVVAGAVLRGPDLGALALGTATGLASIHQAGLVHGNFGPEYVILGPDGRPAVVEYGITPPYGAATPAADMLAWAHTVMFAATAHPPERVGDVAVLPESLREAVAQCLDPDPDDRPAARAVVLDLLGTDDLPAGLLAEGSRRSARRGGYATGVLASPPLASGPAREPGPPIVPAAGGSESPGAPADRARRAERHPAAADSRQAIPRRRAALLSAAAIVVLAVAVAAIAYLVRPAGPVPSADRLPAHIGQVRSGSAAPPSPAQPPPVPSSFAGTWSGVVRQPPADSYAVSVTLRAGAGSGTVSYAGASFSCSGRLSPDAATSTELTLGQAITQGAANCGGGRVTLTRTGATTIRFVFRSSGPAASGTLIRS